MENINNELSSELTQNIVNFCILNDIDMAKMFKFIKGIKDINDDFTPIEYLYSGQIIKYNNEYIFVNTIQIIDTLYYNIYGNTFYYNNEDNKISISIEENKKISIPIEKFRSSIEDNITFEDFVNYLMTIEDIDYKRVFIKITKWFDYFDKTTENNEGDTL